MLKIGDFSKLAHVTVKTLRLYDQEGLLKPAWVDRFNGYRYYTVDQLPRLNRILALRDLGFSLGQIHALLDEALPLEQLRSILRRRQADLLSQLQAEQARLSRVEARLALIEREGQPPAYEVVVKNVPLMRVASIRQVIAHADLLPQSRRQMHLELNQWARSEGVQTSSLWMALYHNPGYAEQKIDLEVAATLSPAPKLHENGRVVLRTLPAVPQMASAARCGGPDNLTDVHQALYSWVSTNGFRITGPLRELYMDDPSPHGGFASMTEIQMPVEPVSKLINSTKGDKMIEPTFVTRPAFIAAGTHYRGKNQNREIPRMWDEEFNPRCSEIPVSNPDCAYGICIMTHGLPEGEFDYYAAAEIARPEDCPAGMEVVRVPAAKYAVFQHHASLEKLHETYNYIYQVWLPSSSYQPAGNLDMEVYTSEFDGAAEEPILYLYVPVVEKKK